MLLSHGDYYFQYPAHNSLLAIGIITSNMDAIFLDTIIIHFVI